MKKYFILLLGLVFLVSGCGKNKTDVNIKDNFVKDNEKREKYLVKGVMNIVSNEDTFTYNVVAAKNKDNYLVNLTNTINNHEQVILRNEDGVYVIAHKSYYFFIKLISDFSHFLF